MNWQCCNLCGEAWWRHGTACKTKTDVAQEGFAPVVVNSIDWLDPIVEKLRQAHKTNAVGGWTRIPTPQARAMALAVIGEYECRRREQEVLDVIDGV